MEFGEACELEIDCRASEEGERDLLSVWSHCVGDYHYCIHLLIVIIVLYYSILLLSL